MPFVIKDRVKETTSTTGTGTLTLGGASPGFQSFSVIGNANTTYYTIVDSASGAWEVGIGTYTLSGTTLSRDTVLESSNSGNLVNFGAGSKEVFCAYPAERAVTTDEAQTLTNKTIALANNTLTGVQATLVSGTNIRTVNNNSLLGSGNITISGGTATAVTTTTSSTNSNFKVPFANTTANTTGDYAYLQDSTTHFTYNPSSNTLNNVSLGTSVSIPNVIIPAANSSTRGGVYGDGSSTDRVAYGFGTNSSYYGTAVGLYSQLSNQGYQSLVGTLSTANSSHAVAVGYNNNVGNSFANTATSGAIALGTSIDSGSTQVGSVLIGNNITASATSGNGIIAIKGRARDEFAPPWTISSSGFYVDPIGSGTTSDVLYYDTTTKQITYGPGGGGGNISLNDLTDVTITNPQNDQVLTYSNGMWINSGGSGPTGYSASPIIANNVVQFSSAYIEVTFANNATALHVKAVLDAAFNNGVFQSFFVQRQGNLFRVDVNPGWGSYGIAQGTILQFGGFPVSSFFTGGPGYVSVEFDGPTANIAQPDAIGTNYFGSTINTAFQAAFTPSNLPYNAYLYSGNFSSSYWTSSQSLQQYPVAPTVMSGVVASGPMLVITGSANAFSPMQYPFGQSSQGRLQIMLGVSTPL